MTMHYDEAFYGLWKRARERNSDDEEHSHSYLWDKSSTWNSNLTINGPHVSPDCWSGRRGCFVRPEPGSDIRAPAAENDLVIVMRRVMRQFLIRLNQAETIRVPTQDLRVPLVQHWI